MARPSPAGGENEMEIFFHISYRRSDGNNFCDQSVIDSGNLIGSPGNLVCRRGCSSESIIIANMTFMCTDFSIENNWSFGERLFTYTFNESANITVAFTGSAWTGFRDWSILTNFSTAKRNDTGRINSTPRAITSPVLQLQANCNHTIRIPVTDPDNDIVRCRWAVGYDECASICDEFPGAVLDPESCSIMYTANSADQALIYRAVAIMIEDFLPGSTVPMSSVGLQFLVLVVDSGSCSVAPVFIPPTPEDDSCVAIPPGRTFHTMLIAVSGNENDSITEIRTVSPAGLQKSDMFHDEDSNVFYVNITWTPTTEQENVTHLFCYTAINSADLSSSQICIKLLPGYTAPAPANITCSTSGITKVKITCEGIEPQVSLQCSFNGGPLHSCTLPMVITSNVSPAGNHSVRIVTNTGTEDTVSYIISDTVEPTVAAQVPSLGVYLINGSPQIIGDSVEAEFQMTRPVSGVRCFLRSEFDRIWEDCSSGQIAFPNLKPGLYVLKVQAFNKKTDVTTVKRGFVINFDPNYCSLVLVNRGVTVSEDGSSVEVDVQLYGPTTQLSCVLDGGEAFNCVSPIELSGLAAGRHKLVISPLDCSGESRPLSVQFAT